MPICSRRGSLLLRTRVPRDSYIQRMYAPIQNTTCPLYLMRLPSTFVREHPSRHPSDNPRQCARQLLHDRVRSQFLFVRARGRRYACFKNPRRLMDQAEVSSWRMCCCMMTPPTGEPALAACISALPSGGSRCSVSGVWCMAEGVTVSLQVL